MSGPSVQEPSAPAVQELRRLATSTAVTAGLLLLESYLEGAAAHEVSSKSTPTDLVSEADRTAERVIREKLAEERPADGFLGEEGESASATAACAGSWTPSTGPSTSCSGYPTGA